MKKKNYLVIKSQNIERLKFKSEREYYCNDFDNVFITTGQENAEQYFNENNVPKKFQKIILEINPRLFRYDIGTDFFTEKPFIVFKNKENYIKGRTFETEIPKYVSFLSEKDYYEEKDIIDFYKELKLNNCLDNYLRALYSFYRTPCKIKSDEKIKKLLKK